MNQGAETKPGFHGKVPTRGDFVGRRLPRDFLEPWDEWLQEAIAASRGQLDDAWLDCYLVSPMWRFALSDGVCGPRPWTGVLMPSVDQVGRYFPLVVAAPLPPSSDIVQLAAGERAWFERVEALLLTAIQEEDFQVEQFDRELQALDLPVVATVAEAVSTSSEEGVGAVRVPVKGAETVAQALPELIHRLARKQLGPYSVWWSDQTDRVESSLLFCPRLPPPQGFAALLDGQWEQWAWESWPAAGAPGTGGS